MLTLIMPAYNVCDHVKPSIDSFVELQRRCDFPCRLVVVDDGSIDGSAVWLKQHLAEIPSATLIQNPTNQGPGAARNRALETVESGYVGFIDADDQLLAQPYLQILKRGMQEGADWITFNGEIINGEVSADRYDLDRLTENPQLMVRRCMKGEFDGSVIFTIYAAELIQRYQLRFPPGLYEDISFAYTAMLLATQRHIVRETAYHKINHPGSIVNSISKRHIDGMLNACFMVREQVIRHQLHRYETFEEDFGYGLFGYVDTLIQSIVSALTALPEQLALLDHLYRQYCRNPVFGQVVERSETMKDRIITHFLHCWERNQQKEQFINDYRTNHFHFSE